VVGGVSIALQHFLTNASFAAGQSELVGVQVSHALHDAKFLAYR